MSQLFSGGGTHIVKQLNNNKPAVKKAPAGGFNVHPENINKNGRPPKGWAWSDILEDLGEVTDLKSGKTWKEMVGRRLWLECLKGNVLAIKELFNRMEGLPRIKMEVDSKVDMKIPQLVTLIDKIFEEDETTDTPKKTKSNKRIS